MEDEEVLFLCLDLDAFASVAQVIYVEVEYKASTKSNQITFLI
jgi:hypothetical protein